MANTRIRALREEKQMSQFELAIRIGVQQPAVYKWEKGMNWPRIPEAIKMADVFGCSLDYLFCRDISSGA